MLRTRLHYAHGVRMAFGGQRPKVRRSGRNVSQRPVRIPRRGFAEGGLAGLVGICRLRRGFLFPDGRMLEAVGWDGPSWLGGSHKC